MSIIGVPILLFVNKAASNDVKVFVTIVIVWVFSVLLVCLVIGPKVYKVEVVSELRSAAKGRNRVKIEKTHQISGTTSSQKTSGTMNSQNDTSINTNDVSTTSFEKGTSINTNDVNA